jgi:hypothetical protein
VYIIKAIEAMKAIEALIGIMAKALVVTGFNMIRQFI